MVDKKVDLIYAFSIILILLIIVLVVQFYKKKRYSYKKDQIIAVKTSKGLIKMNTEAISKQLQLILAELDKHKKMERTSKFNVEINLLIDQLKQFIKNNPKSCDRIKADIKADIIHNSLSDIITVDQDAQSLAYESILSDDELEYGSDSDRFDFLLKNVDFLIQMLNREVCDNGYIDVFALEDLLRKLDADLTAGSIYEKSTGLYSDSNFQTDLGKSLMSRYDPYAISRLSLFESKTSQNLDDSLETELRASPMNYSRKGPQTQFKTQQNSQLHRTNSIRLGDVHYDDDELIQNSYLNII